MVRQGSQDSVFIFVSASFNLSNLRNLSNLSNLRNLSNLSNLSNLFHQRS